MLDWSSDQSPWLRYGVALLFILISTVLAIGGIIWFWGWGIGIAMLCFAGPSEAEKKGYRF